MDIKTFVVNPLGVNCYVVSDETKEAVIIDCGCSTESEWTEIKKYIKEEGLRVVHLLNTHLHFDHVWGTSYAYRDLGLRPEANYEDLHIYEHMDEQIRSVVGMSLPHPPMPPLGRSLLDGDELTFGSTTLHVMSTPGHSRGSVCFLCKEKNVLFSGDTLFCGSCGRTDLAGGSWHDIMLSMNKLEALPEETIVFSGHGPSTTIGREKSYNPYMKG